MNKLKAYITTPWGIVVTAAVVAVLVLAVFSRSPKAKTLIAGPTPTV
jgi:hypothetical protein